MQCLAQHASYPWHSTLTHILPAFQLSGTEMVTEFEGGASQLHGKFDELGLRRKNPFTRLPRWEVGDGSARSKIGVHLDGFCVSLQLP